MILAGIVLYNPDIDRLHENIEAIYNQVEQIIFIDNGSTNIESIKKVFSDNKFIYILNRENFGIAKALNQIIDYADNNNYKWVITLDQDSVCDNSLVSIYNKYINLPKAAILTCNIRDRNISKEENKSYFEYHEIEKCITSASFCSVKALKDIGGFDEWMFIDGVDFDICYNLTDHDYKIYQINYNGLLHEVGHSKLIKIFRREFIVFNHSATRNYYIARNNFYLAVKYKEKISFSKTIVWEIINEFLILFFEKHPVKKIKSRWKGIHDFIQKIKGEA